MKSQLLYRSGMRVAAAVAPHLLRGEGKAARAVRGQRSAHRRIAAWAATHRQPDRPLVWFHAPSVGEGLQARAVIEKLRARRPEVQILYTYFSPSAQGFAAGLQADHADFLPFDLPGSVRAVLDAVRPTAIIFTKTEIWPTLVTEAAGRGIATGILSATLPTGAGRLRWPARALLRPAHALLDFVGAIADEDARRFERLGVPPERISVTGDARFDQVSARAASGGPNEALIARIRSDERPVLVAGSTWPEDEARLLPAIARIAARGHAIRLVAVPHEPTQGHVASLLGRLGEHRIETAVLSEMAPDTPLPTALVVDRVGILGELYGAADLAFVGGGFGRHGIHSVLEPAAFGVPIMFGPFHGNAREAGDLVEAGGGRVASDSAGLAELLEGWMDGAARRAAGQRARAYVGIHLGASDRGARTVEHHIGSHPG